MECVYSVNGIKLVALPEGLRITGLAMVNLRPQQGLQVPIYLFLHLYLYFLFQIKKEFYSY